MELNWTPSLVSYLNVCCGRRRRSVNVIGCFRGARFRHLPLISEIAIIRGDNIYALNSRPPELAKPYREGFQAAKRAQAGQQDSGIRCCAMSGPSASATFRPRIQRERYAGQKIAGKPSSSQIPAQ